MTRPKIPLVPLHALPPGQLSDCFALLADRTRAKTRDDKPYYTCQFRDARRSVAFKVWADSPWYKACEQDWQVGQCYKLRCIYGEHEKYGAQIELHNIRVVTDADRAEGFDPSQVVETSRFNPDELFKQLLQVVQEEIRDAPLKRLIQTLLERFARPLKELPASENRFYPFRGGWLEHVLSVTRSCIDLADHYIAHYPELRPPLNRDLILAGAVLHDIGRVVELSDQPGANKPTIPGELFGHLILGRDLIRDAARELGDVNPELVQLLEHVVLTHLTRPEWGSPRLPNIPEVLILHHADDLDAKMEMYARCLSRDQGVGPFTASDPVLKKPLLKQRNV